MRGKRRARFIVSLMVLVFLTGIFPAIGSAAPAADTEWTKLGMNWGPQYWPAKPVSGGVYQTAHTMYIGLMNPNHWPVNDWITLQLIYDKLIYTDGQYKPAIPWLATSWEYLDDVTVVMKLRQGVQFHDGSSFNAETLKYQMEWIMDPANGAWTRSWLEPVKSIEVVDEYTVKWRFKRPWAGFLAVMANTPGLAISAKALKADVALRDTAKLSRKLAREKKKLEEAEKAAESGDAKARENAVGLRKKYAALEDQYKKTAALAEGAKDLDNHPVGSGPYMFEEGSPGNYVKLKINPNWWFAKATGRKMPYFEGVRMNVIPDPSVRLANLRAGKIDSMTVEYAQYPMIRNDRSLQIFVYPINHLAGMRFNLTQGPCKDIRVRKAISHALDRKALIAGVAFGLGRPAGSMFPDDHWAHNPNLKPIAYDPNLSKKLLAEAGYKNGLTIKGYTINTTYYQSQAEAVKAMLAKVGINWTVGFYDSAAYAEQMRTNDFDFALGGWSWIYDPDLMVTGYYHPDGGFNWGKTFDPKVMNLIEAGRKEIDPAKRVKIYHALDKIKYDNYDDCWLWYPMTVTAFRKGIDGWNQSQYLKFREGQYYSHPMWFKNGRR